VELRKSYRFSGESGIGALSRAVRDENAEESARILESGAFRDLRWRSRSPSSADPLPGALREEVIEGFKRYREIVAAFGVPENSPGALKEIFDRFNEFRILCAVRMGSCGVGAMNRLVEESHEAGGAFGQNRRWYVGKPVMVLRNDYNLRLFNGDIGIYLPRGGVSGPDFRVFFPGPEGRFRHFHPARLPEHETVYAMTVHKSQGSEFEDVLLVLPDGDSKVLTRELVYTAITRAKRSISIRGSGETIKAAIRRSTRRLSGLSDALRSASR
jgi:exodeoxyribonuclease V alpha subunit